MKIAVNIDFLLLLITIINYFIGVFIPIFLCYHNAIFIFLDLQLHKFIVAVVCTYTFVIGKPLQMRYAHYHQKHVVGLVSAGVLRWMKGKGNGFFQYLILYFNDNFKMLYKNKCIIGSVVNSSKHLHKVLRTE